MQLKYRGIDYSVSTTPVETTETGEVGIYRGVALRHRQARMARRHPSIELTYRGVNYLG